MQDDIKILARQEPWDSDVSLRILTETHVGEVTMVPYDGHCVIDNKYTTRLSHTNAQLLMDELWNCGIRPSEGTGSAGSLKATENHLKDMRKILFHTIEMKE